MKKIIIGITDCSKYRNYEQWIKSNPDVDVIKLSYRQNNFDDIKKCNGILLTGGQDVHPKFYQKPDYIEFCEEKDIDVTRDEFELNVLQYTDQQKLPLLGICRGLQIANVFFGGTLIPDIPSFKKSNHSKIHEGNDRSHPVYVEPNTTLKEIVGAESGEINSAHHQATDIVSKELIPNAFSPDGIIEGLERKEPKGKPYLLLVQWHPERMKDQQSGFSRNVKKSFLDAISSS